MFTIRHALLKDSLFIQNANSTLLPENYRLQFIQYHLSLWGPACFILESVVQENNSNEENNKIIDLSIERNYSETVSYKVDKIAGYILTKVDESCPTKGVISSVAIYPEFQGMGLSKVLMNKANEALFKFFEVTHIILQVRLTNEKAISLYKKIGFREEKVQKKYYSKGEDCLVLKLER